MKPIFAGLALIELRIARVELQTRLGKKVEVTVRPAEVASATTAKVEQAAQQRYTVSEIK